ETNLVLWRKIDEYHFDREFLPWAMTISKYQILARIRDQNRERCLLDSGLVEQLADEVESQANQFESAQQALRLCMKSLTEDVQQLLHRRYSGSESIQALADSVQRSTSAVKVSLMRARRRLAECITRRLAMEERV
ncbi:MAG: sigma-70 family RNA polymerase sigma factor, partial [Planctomycetales bacterium]|nr:sigma-70 family RNA polymerase sigma factor [Planctomycetales bacterium]